MSTRINISILTIFHIIGISLFIWWPAAIGLSATNLLLCAVILFIAEDNKPKALLSYILIFLAGFIIEWVGTSTGILFGDYAYGANLGPKVFNVPLIIGVNWVCMVVASSSVALKIYPFKDSRSAILSAIMAGSLATGMDAIIEPVAIKSDYWSWSSNVIPAWNYICWFIFTALLSYIYIRLQEKSTFEGRFLYVLWLVFFTILMLM